MTLLHKFNLFAGTWVDRYTQLLISRPISYLLTCYDGKMLQCYAVAMLQYFDITLLRSRNVTMLQRYDV